MDWNAESPRLAPPESAVSSGGVTLSGDRRRLAEDLRSLFLTLDPSLRRYAARHFLNASSVSRYLNGTRVPPWQFVEGLLTAAGEAGRPLSPSAVDRLRLLHRAALLELEPSEPGPRTSDQEPEQRPQSPVHHDMALHELREAVRHARQVQHELTDQRNRQEQPLRELEALRQRHEQVLQRLEEALSKLE